MQNTKTGKKQIIFNKRSEEKVRLLARFDPSELCWVYKRFPDADVDNYVLWRLIPKINMKNARKGGWVKYKKLDNHTTKQI